MQKYPLTIITKASQILGIKKNQLKNQLKSGVISGEKLVVDGKLKWFIHAQEMENLLSQIIDFASENDKDRLKTEGLEKLFAPSNSPNYELLNLTNANFKELLIAWEDKFNTLKQLMHNYSDRQKQFEKHLNDYQEELKLLKIKNNLLEREISLLSTKFQSRPNIFANLYKSWFK